VSRPKKKPAADAGALPTEIADWCELDRRAEKVRDLWNKAGCHRRVALTVEQGEALAWEIMACAALPVDEAAAKLDTEARAAISTLLAWCQYDPNDNGLPHLVFRDQRLVTLEAALLRAQELAEVRPTRPWVNRAWSIWSRVSAILKTPGRQASWSANSYAVRFTALALQWAGYPSATAPAISGELSRNPAFRKRMCG
jgi:hypothetical protein